MESITVRLLSSCPGAAVALPATVLCSCCCVLPAPAAAACEALSQLAGLLLLLL
jgi:hypothetical protein